MPKSKSEITSRNTSNKSWTATFNAFFQLNNPCYNFLLKSYHVTLTGIITLLSTRADAAAMPYYSENYFTNPTGESNYQMISYDSYPYDLAPSDQLARCGAIISEAINGGAYDLVAQTELPPMGQGGSSLVEQLSRIADNLPQEVFEKCLTDLMEPKQMDADTAKMLGYVTGAGVTLTFALCVLWVGYCRWCRQKPQNDDEEAMTLKFSPAPSPSS